MRLHTAAPTVDKTPYHVVWVTRYRKNILVPGVQRSRHVKLEEVRKDYPDWEYAAIGMEVDHVHLHGVIPPTYAVSVAGETMKKNTSRALSEIFAVLKPVDWDGEGIWSTGYCVSTVGMNEAIIRRYVEMPGQEDAGQAEREL